ncbi:RHS repeat-associated core domain containing protein [Nitzschia inconspicua]|uniref:RHS repeat-associated core domain containing protein n=1 Tax=Nitzschia inconspicua TaxID=303405 RepID=A0A9K3P7W1_9STRA|nr:RHS repeat-associated core domain containing protein [Nitzschia inconspicua]KAG7368882.1 RHS repeat-associated core domain containing protein [Nitzschia inconspicua]
MSQESRKRGRNSPGLIAMVAVATTSYMRINVMSPRKTPHVFRKSSRRTWRDLALLLFTTSWCLLIFPLRVFAATPSQKEILDQLYDATDGDEWSLNTNWKSINIGVCSWHGVFCNDRGDVTRLELDRNNLSGSIPPDFWKLSTLTEVNLRANLLLDASFHGLESDDPENDPRAPINLLILAENQLSTIQGIGNLHETLEYINLNKNRIDQTLPDDLFDLTNVKTLYVAFNQLTGTLPTLIGKLTKMTEFYAFRNHLTGPLPSELGRLDKCQIFGVGNNLWSGTLPTELNDMVNMRDLSIHNSPTTEFVGGNDVSTSRQHVGITGPLLSFGNMPYLSMLYLDGNNLSGSIPPDFLRHNNNIEKDVTVGLRNNKLTGAIPKALERFEKLNIELVGNSIDSIPPELCEKGGWMGGLVEEYGCNAILCPMGTYSVDGHETGANAGCAPCRDGSTYLGATSCSSDEAIYEPWETLARFYLAMGGDKWERKDGWEMFDTLFDGETSEELAIANITVCNGWYGVLCHEGVPTRLSLPNNNLFGVVPRGIFDISWSVFDLSDNNVQMEDLSIITEPDELTSLILSNTKVQSLSGIERLTKLQQLYLDGLTIKGAIPNALFDLTGLKTLHLQHSAFTGVLPTEVGKLKHLERLNMYGNFLSGYLPSELGLLSLIRSLDLSENRFRGTIPSTIVNWTALETFALHQSEGDLGGPLPAFDTFPSLKGLFLQENNFEGQIPDNFLGGIADKSIEVAVSLASNNLTGSVPLSLSQFSNLIINLEGNVISELDDRLCVHEKWMQGELNKLPEASRCNGIMCPPGTWNEFGKETVERRCDECSENKSFYGQVRCGDLEQQPPERRILDRLFAMTGGRYWTKPHENWLKPGVSVCEWEGIMCANVEGEDHILEVNLDHFGLRGTIPSEVWNLRHARRLKFSVNAVSVDLHGIENAEGLLVLQMSNCHQRSLEGIQNAPSKLFEIHFSENQFEGTIPTDIFQLTSVTKLFLNNNHFSGRIPSEIHNMKQLDELWIGGNKFTGAIPSEIGLMTNLRILSLKQNDLSGAIPLEIQNLPSLENLDISSQRGNQFNGPLPPFDSNPNLVIIDASDNAFSGTLPKDFLKQVDRNAQIKVDLSNNAFVGAIPIDWSIFDSLNIDLSGNQLTSLPDVLCNQNGWNGGRVGLLDTCDAILCPPGTHLKNLGRQMDPMKPCEPCELGMASAPFYGTRECLDPEHLREREILVSFYDATNGTSWLSQRNWLSTKPVCIWQGIVCNELGLVDSIQLGDNFVVAGPDAVAEVSKILSLKELKTLDLKGNDVTLNFEAIKKDATKLEFLRLSGTKMTSLDGVSNAVNLKALHATNNNISRIPDELYSMSNLESIFLSFNAISGHLSHQIGLLTNLKELYLFGNQLTGTIPTQIGLMTSLVDFVASHNALSGSLPDQVSTLQELEQFSVNSQHGLESLTGPVPSFSGAPKLWYFDASDNDLTGPIPDNFMINSIRLNETVTVYLQHNEIEGTIPPKLVRFSFFDLNLAENKIVEIPKEICGLRGWMQGYVGLVGNCSAILCPRGTFNQFGYHLPENPCLRCSHLDDLPFLGNTHCEDFSSERDTLEKLFDDTGGEFWGNSTSWYTNAPVCSWFGVRCADGDPQDTSGITHITLEANGLSGTLPSEIWTLPSLKSFKMDENEGLVINLEGVSNAADTLDSLSLSHVKITSLDGIGSLTNLKKLSLVGNELAGTFPEELFKLSNTLESLYIGYNLLYGPLPSRLGVMSQLQVFNAFDNNFFSTIPSELARMQNLRTLVLSENLIYGEIPQEMSAMPSLRGFAANREEKAGPRLSGSLPSFDQVPQLIYLYLQGNELQGSIPSNFLSASKLARFIGLSSNLLTGRIPGELEFLSGLDLEVDDNKIEGFPDSFCSKVDWNARAVGIYGCEGFLCPPGTASPIGRTMNETTKCRVCPEPKSATFYGTKSCDGGLSEREILVNFYKALNGDDWYRNDFWLSKTDVCEWYGIACSKGKVIHLNLRGNNLRGLPGPEIFDLRELRVLWLYSNPITFSFENIGRARKLYELRLDATKLHSLHGIGAASSLISFDARFTNLKGSLPEEVLRLSNLRILSLGHNKLSGTLPKSFGSLKYLQSLRLNANSFSGPLPSFDDMHFLKELDFSENFLTGSVSRNFLSKIPDQTPLMLSLSQNQLTGVIPEEFDRFHRASLYLSDNLILGMPLTLCDNVNWNNGDVGDFGCDGILCKPGTFNPNGRRVHGMECFECSHAVYYGETECETDSSSAFPKLGWAWTILASLLLVAC